MCAWLIHVATGTSPGQVTLPLPDTPPQAFCMIPEHIVSDMATLLMLTTVGSDDMGRMDDVILACTALMGSPSHVTNPYLRYTLCTVLHQWIPDSASSSRRRCGPALPTHLPRLSAPIPVACMRCAPAAAAYVPSTSSVRLHCRQSDDILICVASSARSALIRFGNLIRVDNPFPTTSVPHWMRAVSAA